VTKLLVAFRNFANLPKKVFNTMRRSVKKKFTMHSVYVYHYY